MRVAGLIKAITLLRPSYEAAKAGDAGAAESLVLEMSPIGALDRISEVLSGTTPHLLAVHALETSGMNAIPQVFAKILSRMLDLPVATGIIQINRVTHTGASGYHRLAFPALFGGEVREEAYFLVDDFIGQGGTFGLMMLTPYQKELLLRAQKEIDDRLDRSPRLKSLIERMRRAAAAIESGIESVKANAPDATAADSF